MEAVCFSETLASTYESTRRKNLKNHHPHRRENLRSHKLLLHLSLAHHKLLEHKYIQRLFITVILSVYFTVLE
jgi:hypothetical protein